MSADSAEAVIEDADVQVRSSAPPKIGRQPHMPPETARYLAERLAASRCYLEYGSGGSTRLAASLNVPDIFTVESDEAFGARLRRLLRAEVTSSRIRMVRPQLGPARKWGAPMTTEACERWPDYALKVWRVLDREGCSPDLILIDGRFRVACFLATLIKAGAGAVILVDDYANRQRAYHRIRTHATPTRMIGRMAEFVVPADLRLGDLAIDLAQSCVDIR